LRSPVGLLGTVGESRCEGERASAVVLLGLVLGVSSSMGGGGSELRSSFWLMGTDPPGRSTFGGKISKW